MGFGFEFAGAGALGALFVILAGGAGCEASAPVDIEGCEGAMVGVWSILFDSGGAAAEDAIAQRANISRRYSYRLNGYPDRNNRKWGFLSARELFICVLIREVPHP